VWDGRAGTEGATGDAEHARGHRAPPGPALAAADGDEAGGDRGEANDDRDGNRPVVERRQCEPERDDAERDSGDGQLPGAGNARPSLQANRANAHGWASAVVPRSLSFRRACQR